MVIPVLVLFPAWPLGHPASFRLRVEGAFIVSASWDGHRVEAPVRITSEAGRRCTVENPYAPRKLCIHDGAGQDVGSTPEATEHATASFATRAGGTYTLSPC